MWYNTQIPKVVKEQGLFDSEGIFVGDASYVFVPDNENYEGSALLFFDEHNHPVKKEELTAEQLKRCTYKRRYKWVELIHTNRKGEFFFFVAMQLVSGKNHENPIFYKMVEDFLQIVGCGVMKWLIVDRGLLDGEEMEYLKREWGVDTLSGLKSNMVILEDARGLLRMGDVHWQEYQPVEPLKPSNPVLKPKEIIKREEAGQRTLKNQGRWSQPSPKEKVCVFNDLTSWDACPLPLT